MQCGRLADVECSYVIHIFICVAVLLKILSFLRLRPAEERIMIHLCAPGSLARWVGPLLIEGVRSDGKSEFEYR